MFKPTNGVPGKRFCLLGQEPAEEKVVVQLFHQLPLAAHRVQRLQQQGTHQLLRRDRRPPAPGIERVEVLRHPRQSLIHHPPDRPQRMVLRNPILRTHITEHTQLLLIVASHPSSII
jgi:hypothetical protein